MPGDSPDTVGHAEIEIGDGLVMLADEFPDHGFLSPRQSVGGTPVTVARLRRGRRRGVRQGAWRPAPTTTREMENQFYGDRSGQFEDPFGHRWSVATHVEEVSEEEMARRMADMDAVGGAAQSYSAVLHRARRSRARWRGAPAAPSSRRPARRRRRPPRRRGGGRRRGRAGRPRSTAAARRGVRRHACGGSGGRQVRGGRERVRRGVGEQLGGMAHVETRRPEVHRAPGVRRDDDRAAPACHGAPPGAPATLRSRIGRRELGLAARVGAARAAAQAVVGGVAQPVGGREHGAHRALRPAARGAGGTGPARRRVSPVSRSAAAGRAPRPTPRSRARGPRTPAPRACRAGGRSPSSPRRTRRCRRRRVASPGIDPITRVGPASGPSPTRPAWACSAPQQSPPRPGSPTLAPGGAHDPHARRGACRAATRP